MARYIIDIEDDAKDGLYKAKNFNTLVFDKEGLDRLELYEDPEKPEENKPWRAEENCIFYFVRDDLSVCMEHENHFEIDDSHYNVGNYFRTKEEAQEVAERLKVYTELKRFAVPNDEQVWDGNNLYYYFRYDYERCKICIADSSIYKDPVLYLASFKQAQKAIEEIGAERVKRYYFGIKD